MNRLILIFACSTIFICANAQFSMGLTAGAGAATLHTTYGEKKFFHLTPSWNTGLFENYRINSRFMVQSSIVYITKGYRDYVRESEIRYNDYYRVNYLEFCPQFFYIPSFMNGKFMVGLGPSLSYGLNGKWKQKGLVASISETHGKLIFLDDLKDSPDDITVGVYGKKFDFGGRLSIGYQYNKRISFLLNGTGSMLNIAPTQYGFKPTYTDKNVAANLSIQYCIK